MLSLDLGLEAGRVLITTSTERVSNLRQIATRFVTATTVGARSIEIDIDDLLVNLSELASWPLEDEVSWSNELRSLVQDNFKDAASISRQLAGAGDGESIASGVPPEWSEDLRPFQRRDVESLLKMRHGANFSVPGAGKTRASVALFCSRLAAKEVDRLIVIGPKSAFESWQTELSRAPGLNGAKAALVVEPGSVRGRILMLNYERLSLSTGPLIHWMRQGKAMLVLDEAHRMKLGMRGQWGAACMKLAPFAVRRLILSGTPAPNGAQDLENLFSFVWPGQGARHVRDAMSQGGLKAASVALSPLFVRTTKSELELPPMDVRVRRVALPPLHREIYDALVWRESVRLRRDGRNLAELGKVILYLIMAATSPALVAAGASRHEALAYRVPPLELPSGADGRLLLEDLPNYEFSPKYLEVAEIVRSNWASGRKTLVWSTFVRNLTTLERILSPYSPAVVHGGTLDRDDQIRRFREDANCGVLLSNPATLGEGISLHAVCHDAIYVDRDFSAGRFLQSIDRIHRLGLPANTETRVTILVAEGTIDELVETRLQQKLDFMGGILNDVNVSELGDMFEEVSESAGLDQGDVQALLKHLSA